MNMFGRQSSRIKDGAVVAVFNVASASVGGLFFRYHKNKQPEILSSAEQQAPFGKNKDFKSTWKVLHAAFDEVAKHLKKTNETKPEHAFCVFSTPWFISQTKIIKMERQRDCVIDNKLLDSLLENEASLFAKQWQTSVVGKKTKSVFLEKEIMKSVINGYDVYVPKGVSVKNLELYAYLSLVHDMLEEKVKLEILNFIKPHNIYFQSFPFVLFETLKNIYDTKTGMLAIDTTGELTDVILIKNDIIAEANCFGKGENFLVRRLATAFNYEFDQAQSLLFQYQRNELEPKTRQKVAEVLSFAADEWATALIKMIKTMSEKQSLPQKMILCCPDYYTKEIADRLNQPELVSLTAMGMPFEISFIRPDIFQKYFYFENGFSNSKNSFLLISAFFANNRFS